MSEEKPNICNNECQCSEAGFCPVYGITMTKRLHRLCQTDEVWRKNFQNFFAPPANEAERQEREDRTKESRKMSANKKRLDEVINEVEESGVNLDNYEEKQEGLGNLLAGIFGKLGITEKSVEEWSGIQGCGCDKRKQFLNKILPFRKKE
tara:strand:- start:585 stop:1034 length:450 start_codon:yes stop_codon:yes gene_type:complete